MSDLSPGRIALAALAGAALAVFFFGGLWWTVRRLPASRRPGVLMAVSLILRLAVTGAGILLVGRGRWENLLACLAGFLVARTLVMRRLGSRGIMPPGTGGPASPEPTVRPTDPSLHDR